ncbi:ribonuclease III [Pseudanabaena mucicola]|uniref:Ribonuclease 3 n=1 Tax=Pseudanabaena mucicola FACHB-723 TaxID=2692860 RepID=A0ABR7ZXK6_9CYAN|nr:ribonuclease III [Pseudanabaena mucicola]MBD2188572.1 ribonuclease III [Pseudanabaena mucicola FACHB-723]
MKNLFTFKNDNLLRMALTHRSYVHEHPTAGSDNERLEFLGDAILNFLSGSYLYRQHPELGEDELTRRRAALVDEKQLANFAIALGLDQQILLGKGALRDGGNKSDNLLSCAFEAIVGAYYLDCHCDVEALRPAVETLFESVPAELVNIRADLDAKNRLQEWVQSYIGHILPRYVTEKVGGTDHIPEFASKVYVGDRLYGQSLRNFSSKKEAERAAALDALEQIERML